MDPSRVGDDGHQVTPKVTQIKATYYHYPRPQKPPMARRMSLIERIKRATSSNKENR